MCRSLAKVFTIQKEKLKSIDNDSVSILNTSTVIASEDPGVEIIIIIPAKKP